MSKRWVITPIYSVAVLLLLVFFTIPSTAGQSFEGTTKGTTITQGIQKTIIKLPTDYGPWSKKDIKTKPIIGVIIACKSDNDYKILNDIYDFIQSNLSQEPSFELAQSGFIEKLLKYFKLQKNIKAGTKEFDNALNDALLKYDIVIVLHMNQGFFITNIVRALSNTSALTAGFGVYLGNKISEKTIQDLLDKKLFIKSINDLIEGKSNK